MLGSMEINYEMSEHIIKKPGRIFTGTGKKVR